MRLESESIAGGCEDCGIPEANSLGICDRCTRERCMDAIASGRKVVIERLPTSKKTEAGFEDGPDIWGVRIDGSKRFLADTIEEAILAAAYRGEG